MAYFFFWVNFNFLNFKQKAEQVPRLLAAWVLPRFVIFIVWL